jgi:SAM-dependent methyltransferase
MSGESSDFWDRRYRTEGAIWGEGPSPTAALLATLLATHAHVLDIGFGYGRDLVYMAARGFRVSGIETSGDGHAMALERLARKGLRAEQLYHGRFEHADLPCGAFDAVLNHRMAHLLTSAAAVAEFAACIRKVLRPHGLLALAARSLLDYDPAQMVQVEPHVYEYRARPGHRIRYWDDEAVRLLGTAGFDVMRSGNETEPETVARPVPCHLLVLVLRANQTPVSLPASPRGRLCP